MPDKLKNLAYKMFLSLLAMLLNVMKCRKNAVCANQIFFCQTIFVTCKHFTFVGGMVKLMQLSFSKFVFLQSYRVFRT